MNLFGTAGIRGEVGSKVTPERALTIGRAAGIDARERGDTKFVVGRDGRETGRALMAAVTAGLVSAGGDVIQVGCVPTPALAFASRDKRGVMITASHNPPKDNGIKLFRDGIEYDQEAEQGIEELVAASVGPVTWNEWGEVESEQVLDSYRTAVVGYAEQWGEALEELSVVVDCGNGMGGSATPQVLRALGAHIVALNANVDGTFPARAPKPTPVSEADLRAFMEDGDFDLGIAHDGDADRIVIIDSRGEIVHEDTVVAILAERYVQASTVSDPVVVTTPNASTRIDDRVHSVGGRVERIRLGALHEGIARVHSDDGVVVFAAEPWKHLHTNFGGWIDGVVSAAVLARLTAAEGLDGLREPVWERPYQKVNVRCPDELKLKVMERVTAELPGEFDDPVVDTEFGLRVSLSDDSWILVRASGTEPYLRIYVESERVEDLVQSVSEVVERVVAELDRS